MTRIRPSLLACMILLFSLPVPFLQADDLLNADHEIAAAVDHYIDARMAIVNLTPSSPAPDSTLLRRTMLDLVGRIPTAAEARQYSASPLANKRLEMVKLLLGDQGFMRHTANELNTLLSDERNENLRPYLLESLSSNKGWDQMFREMINGDTSQSSKQGPTSFILQRVNDLDKLTNATSAIFFGINIIWRN